MDKSCRPPKTAASGTWHWLRHRDDSNLKAKLEFVYVDGRMLWQIDTLEGVRATGGQLHAWGWRYVAEAVPPETPDAD